MPGLTPSAMWSHEGLVAYLLHKILPFLMRSLLGTEILRHRERQPVVGDAGFGAAGAVIANSEFTRQP